MEDEVRIPVILTTDKSSLSKVKEEIEKTVAKAQEYEKSMSSKRKTYRVKGLEDTALQMDNLIAKIGELQSVYSTISNRGPFDKLKKAHEDVAEAVRTLTKDTEELRNLNNSLGGKSNAKNQAEARLKALQDQTEELQKQKELELQTAKDNGESKKKLAEIEQEYSAQQKVLESKKQEANIEFLAKRAVYDRVLAERDAAKASEESSREKLAQLRELEAEEAKRTSHPEYESQYAQAQAAELEKLKGLIREYGEELENTRHKYEEMLQADKEASGYAEKERAAEKLKAAENGVAESTKKSADASKDESKSNKDSTAQFYYKLRAIKMLGHTIDQAYKAMDRFGKKSLSVAKGTLSAYTKLLPGVWAVQKAMQKATTQQKKFGREIGGTTRAHESFNLSLKKGITTVLKYGFGIRSLYILFRKLRQAITDGLGEMSQQFEDVNVRMSSILTSVNYMKASLTTIAEPLITILAPALEKIAEIVANISYHVASFIAALSGQKNVYKAVKVQSDYAESLDKTAKNAKKAKKELAGFDELNVLHSDDDEGKDYTMGWELVPALTEAFPIIDKIKDILSTLLDPIKKAWEKMKDFVINSFKYMVDRLKSLAGTIWDDFLKVWTDGRVQKIFEDIFKIVGDIFLIIGNIAEAFEEAWKANDNGYRVLSAIVDIIGSIVDGIKRCADITVEWSKRLTFVPLFTAIADVMQQQVVPAVQKVVDLFVYLYEHVFLELVRYVVEDLAPTLVRAFGNVIETVGNIANKIREALELNGLGDKIIAQFESLVTIIGNKILEVSEKTKEWSKGLDFTPFFEAVLNFLNRIEPMVQTIADAVGALWTEVILPFWEYIIEDGGPRLLDLLGKIFGQKDENTGFGIDWEKVTNDINALLPVLEQFLELAWDVLLQIIKDLGKAFDDFVNSDNFTKIIEGFKNWVDEADPEEIAHKIETFVETFVGLYATFKLFATIIMPVVEGFMTVGNAINNLVGANGIGGLLSGLGKISPAVMGVIAVLGLMVASFGGVGNTIKEIKERIDEVSKHFSEFGEKINLSEKFDKLKEAVERLRPVFEALLDIIGGVVTVFGETLMGALGGFADMVGGIVDTLLGMWKTIEGASQFLGAAIVGDTEGMKEGWSKFVDGMLEIGGAFIEFFTGLFDSITGAIAGFVDLALPDAAKKILEWKDKVVGFFEDLAYQLIGDPIVYDIQDGILESFEKWIEDTIENVKEWVKNIVDNFKELKDKLKQIKDNISKAWKNLVDKAKTSLKNLIANFEEKLSPSTFLELGRNAIDGLVSGLTSGLRSALSEVSEICSSITNRVKNAFKIHSPSKVFAEIGENLMRGMAEGIGTAADVTYDSLKEVYDKIMDKSNNLVSQAQIRTYDENLTRVDSRIKDIEKQLSAYESEYRRFDDERANIHNKWNASVRNAFTGRGLGVVDFWKHWDEISSMTESALRTKLSSLNTGATAQQLDEIVKELKALAPQIAKEYNSAISKRDATQSEEYLNLTKQLEESQSEYARYQEQVEKFLTGEFNEVLKLQEVSNKYASSPAIAKGSVLPSTTAFNSSASQNQNDNLVNSLKNALIESFSDMRYNGSSNNEDIVVQIDGYEVFRAVRNQSDMFRTSAGYGAL